MRTARLSFACCLTALLVGPGSSWAADWHVRAGDSLQTTLNAAQPGDTILLQAGTEFVGNFRLPAKNGTQFITIKSDAAVESLPPSGQRTSPSYHAYLPRLRTANTDPVLATDARSSYWRIENVEFVPASNGTTDTLVTIGRGDSTQNSLSLVPTQIVLDRILIDVAATVPLKRAVGMNGAYTEVRNSYIAGVKVQGYDSQALCGWNGPGPYYIENNYLEASGENIMFGGADTSITDLVPSDIFIRGNFVTKRWSWWNQHPTFAGTVWSVKNLLELKNARRVTIEGNVFENCWLQSQTGTAILFTTRNQSGTNPWAVVRDIVFRNNRVSHAAGALVLLCHDAANEGRPSQHMTNVTISNNLWVDIDAPKYNGSSGVVFAEYAGGSNVTFDHNTVIDGTRMTLILIGEGGHPAANFVFTNNLGMGGLGASGLNADDALRTWTTSPTVRRNTFAAVPEYWKTYTTIPDNVFVSAEAFANLFTNFAGGDYSLASSAAQRGAGTDGKDVGVDFAALNASAQKPTPRPPVNIRTVP